MSTLRSLPVFMYHYVNHTTGAITVTPEHFADQCRWLSDNGWRGVSLAEAEGYLRDGEPLPPRSVLFTFDDGFLDNAVYAAPIMRQYGHCGVVFAVTERLEHRGGCRPTLDDVNAGTTPASRLRLVDDIMHDTPHGLSRQDIFLSWDEARALDASNVAIAAHSARHLAVYAAPEWTELRTPGPRSNTFYHLDAPALWGMPRFKERPALYARAFIPSDRLLHTVTTTVPQNPEEAGDFFQSPSFVADLTKRLRAFSGDQLGRYETDAERESRVASELQLCADTLSRELAHPVTAFCWPWGGASDLARNLARDLGFSTFFTTAMGPNPPKQPSAVHRFKVRDKKGGWLGLRCGIHSNPLISRLYTAFRI